MSSGRQALIVAVDEYSDPGLGQLRAPQTDAEALGHVLADPRIGDFNVNVLRNETAQGIRVAVEDFFADRRPDDLLLLHFSCHGLKNAAGELFLAASDSRPTRLASTAVAADFVNQQMADSRAQRIALFLDCCYGGAFPRGMVVRASGVVEVGDAFAAAQEAAGGRGRVVVTASSSVEYAFEGGELAPGSHLAPSVFTGSVVEGLSSGDADRDGDGWVGLNELFTYVAERVRQATPHQTPHMWAFGSEGDLLLAHSRRRRVTADPLPRELLDAAGSSLPATRYGVAVELRDRLLGDDLGQALAAWNALSAMVNDDSRRVSAFVGSVLQQAALQVSPAALELGSHPLGQPSVQELRLTGSPLALAATADSADEWLRCEVDPGRVQVTVAPQVPGEHVATIVLATPMGEFEVPVRVEVVEGAAVPSARSAPVQPAAPALPSPRPATAQAPTAQPVTTTGPDPTPPGDPSTVAGKEARLWWPVSAALLVIGIGLWLVHKGFSDTVWVQPNDANLGPKLLLDGLSLAPLVLIAFVIGALLRPRFALFALGVAAGVALFFLTWSLISLGTSRIRDDPSLVWMWRNYFYLGLAAILVAVVELWHRHSLHGRLLWRRPARLEAGLLVVGAVLAFDATRQRFDHELVTVLYGKPFLVLPVFTVALSCLGALTWSPGDRATVIITAAVTYLGASSSALIYIGLSADAPYAAETLGGNALLLLGLAARRGGPRWPGTLIHRRKSPVPEPGPPST